MDAGLEHDIQIVELPAMRVVSVRAPVSASPEVASMGLLKRWAESRGRLDAFAETHDPRAHRVFGFNNALRAGHLEGDESYGYELWLVLAQDERIDLLPEDEPLVRVRQVPGRTYAMTRSPLAATRESWRALFQWCRDNGYRILQSWHKTGSGHWEQDPPGLEAALDPLEEHVDRIVLDLYLPVAVV